MSQLHLDQPELCPINYITFASQDVEVVKKPRLPQLASSNRPLPTSTMSFVHPPTVPTLYHSKWFCSSIPLWALLELQVPETEVAVVSISQEQLKSDPTIAKITPRHVLPVLAFPDGTTIVEAGAILLYLLEKFDTAHKLHPAPNSPLRAKFLQHLFYAVSEAYSAVVAMFMVTRTPKEERDRVVVEPLMKKYNTVVVEYLERELDHGKSPYLLGDEFTAADMAFGYIIMTASFCEGEDTLVSEVAKSYHIRCSERELYGKLFNP